MPFRLDAALDRVLYSDLALPKEPLADFPVHSFRPEWETLSLPRPPSNTQAVLEELPQLRSNLLPGGPFDQHRADIIRQDRAEEDPLDLSTSGVIEQEFWTLIERRYTVPALVKVEAALLTNEVVSIGTHFKRRFDRLRPQQLAVLTQYPLALPFAPETAQSPSYPSNHALIGAFLALYLSDLYPELRPSLVSLGEEIGLNRVYAAIHFPSDYEAGRTLATLLWPLLRSPAP